jgi:hypothetical protein
MKTKKFTKKLVLSKKTIVNLNGNAMMNVLGGATIDDCSWEHKIALSVCPTTCYTCLNTGCMC